MSGGNMQEVPGTTQYAKKLRNLLDQFQKLSKVAGESDSARVRAQAEREITRLEQALGDNLAELQEGNRSVQEWSQAARIGQVAVEQQWANNDALIQESRQAQEQLRETRKKREKEAQGKAPPSKEEQAFLDTGNFLKRSWYDNKSAQEAVQQRAEQLPAQVVAGAPSLDALVEESPFHGLLNVTVSKDVPVAELSQPTPVDAAKGLKPVPEISGPAAAPAMEMALEPKGYETYTFHRLLGDAEVELSFLRSDAAPRLAAIIALVVVPVTLIVLRRRAQASSRTR
jgi:hypothetical protein